MASSEQTNLLQARKEFSSALDQLGRQLTLCGPVRRLQVMERLHTIVDDLDPALNKLIQENTELCDLVREQKERIQRLEENVNLLNETLAETEVRNVLETANLQEQLDKINKQLDEEDIVLDIVDRLGNMVRLRLLGENFRSM